MLDFKQGITNILVSTTVIEVGIDIPDATVMIIYNAERF
jgi:ATP-dependent DNA helicase RecG